MRRTWWPLCIIAAVMLLALTMGPSFGMVEERLVTLDLRDSPVGDALRIVFRDTPFSYTLSPEVDKQRKVTVSLNDVPFAVALRAIGNAANLEITAEPDNASVYVVKPRPMVTMGGAQIPVVGAMTLGPDGADASGGTGTGRNWRVVGPMDNAALLAQLDRAHAFIVPPIGPGEKLVDLDVKEVPIREAMAQLSKASGLEITVHPAVSQQIKVTARAFAVPAEWLLNTIANQSRLSVMKECLPQEPAASPEAVARQLLHQRFRYHLVPPPEIRVTGVPGAPVTPMPSAVPTMSPR